MVFYLDFFLKQHRNNNTINLSVGPYTGPTCGTCRQVFVKRSFFAYFEKTKFFVLFLDIDYCANKNCLNGGICKPDYVNQVGVCSCLEDYFGDLCEQSRIIIFKKKKNILFWD